MTCVTAFEPEAATKPLRGPESGEGRISDDGEGGLKGGSSQAHLRGRPPAHDYRGARDLRPVRAVVGDREPARQRRRVRGRAPSPNRDLEMRSGQWRRRHLRRQGLAMVDHSRPHRLAMTRSGAKGAAPCRHPAGTPRRITVHRARRSREPRPAVPASGQDRRLPRPRRCAPGGCGARVRARRARPRQACRARSG